MARRSRLLVLVSVLALAAVPHPLAAVAPALAASRSGAVDVGWVRVARVVLRSVQPWVTALLEAAFDAWPECGDGSPPAPSPIVESPPQDPEFTP